jgi:hypothetical protein
MLKLVRGALIGSAITLALYVVPIVHFVGPLIGGIVGAAISKIPPVWAWVFGPLMAFVTGLAVTILGQVVASILRTLSIELPFGESGGFLILGGVIATHSLILGTLGALLGSYISSRSKDQEESL